MAMGLKHELESLLKEFEGKASLLPGGSRQEMLKIDQCREHYMVESNEKTLIKRKLDQYCSQVDREQKMAHHNFAQTKDRLYAKK